jgi:hypothetical protein
VDPDPWGSHTVAPTTVEIYELGFDERLGG